MILANEVVTFEANTAVVTTILGAGLVAGFGGIAWLVRRVLQRMDDQDKRLDRTATEMVALNARLSEHMKLEELDHVHRQERQGVVDVQLRELSDGQHQIRERLAVIESHITPGGPS